MIEVLTILLIMYMFSKHSQYNIHMKLPRHGTIENERKAFQNTVCDMNPEQLKRMPLIFEELMIPELTYHRNKNYVLNRWLKQSEYAITRILFQFYQYTL